jgi:hypothetical protein
MGVGGSTGTGTMGLDGGAVVAGGLDGGEDGLEDLAGEAMGLEGLFGVIPELSDAVISPSQVGQLQICWLFSCVYAQEARMDHMSAGMEFRMLLESQVPKADVILSPPVLPAAWQIKSSVQDTLPRPIRITQQ